MKSVIAVAALTALGVVLLLVLQRPSAPALPVAVTLPDASPTTAPMSTPAQPAAGETASDPNVLIALDAPPGSGAPLTIDEVQLRGDGRPAVAADAGGADYDFPTIERVDGRDVMVVPDAPIPTVGSRRLLRAGNGPLTRRGQLAELRFDIFSWSTGARVGGSERYPQGTRTVRLGAVPGLPAAIDRAVIGRAAGSRVQVILPRGTADLPGSANPHDAHVVVVDVLATSASRPDALDLDLPAGLLGDAPR